MPESVTDRCTKAHEYLFLLSKAARYHYDAEAISEPAANAEKINTMGPKSLSKGQAAGAGVNPSGNALKDTIRIADRANRRSVWTIPTQPYAEAHFATFPEKLVEPALLAGCPVGGVVLDPFSGSATVGLVAARHGRRYVGVELSADYLKMSVRRLRSVLDQPYLFDAPAAAVAADPEPEADLWPG
jgi:DNA modification methylase